MKPIPHRRGSRSGQTMLFALMALVIAVLAVLWMFDVHKTLFVKAFVVRRGNH